MPDMENSRKQPKHKEKQLLTVSAVFSGCFSAILHLFRQFFGCFQCRAFGTSVDGHRDCNLIIVCAKNTLRWANFEVLGQ